LVQEALLNFTQRTVSSTFRPVFRSRTYNVRQSEPPSLWPYASQRPSGDGEKPASATEPSGDS
jgi:hypothetical protein